MATGIDRIAHIDLFIYVVLNYVRVTKSVDTIE